MQVQDAQNNLMVLNQDSDLVRAASFCFRVSTTMYRQHTLLSVEALRLWISRIACLCRTSGDYKTTIDELQVAAFGASGASCIVVAPVELKG